MDGHGRLNRTTSSLLRSSTTVRSSFHSLSSIEPDHEPVSDLEEQKIHKRPGSPPIQPGSCWFIPVLALFSLSLYTLLLVSQKDDVAGPENLILALTLAAIALFFVAKSKGLLNKTRVLKKLGFLRDTQKPVRWFIGDLTEKKPNRKKEEIIREGVEFYSNGDFYEGEFHKGKSNGSGVYNYFVNGRYEGDWVDGKYDGYGIEGWARGSRYRGMYRQGLRHGVGVYRFYTGDTYAGEWCNGQSYGVGVQTCSDGSCYVGEFKLGVKHGIGCYHFRNGDRYTGEYFADKIHGFGIYHFANGHSYEGSWHEGRKQGYGMYLFRNGDTKCGEWDCGNLKTPLPQPTDAVLRAVQAARKTGENAIHIRRVDEQVNKAVTAATRAATAARVAAIKAVQNRINGKFCETDSY